MKVFQLNQRKPKLFSIVTGYSRQVVTQTLENNKKSSSAFSNFMLNDTRRKQVLWNTVQVILLCYCQAHIADVTYSQWVTCFQESAEMILGRTAIEVGELKDSVSVLRHYPTQFIVCYIS